ncbi:hypothetical protein NLG97_g5612 [Lecanicillium saksenae]|uniref:Uncharacterized protein n=1 Tax=Lecanicillium saksenae TaxID=468837 RepID=A0ACC1QTP5_9HYPO|nr:hypothetical protein NLG97_g5612 [Lecanicillium saksenae]
MPSSPVLGPLSPPLSKGDRGHGDGRFSESASSADSLASASTPATEADDGEVVELPNKLSQQVKILPEVPFDSAVSRALFNAIDELRSVSVFVAAPQLVVVGAQSVGKSSLLQSLTGIPFPVGAGLCTRFPMRIVSKQTEPNSTDRITISVEPPDYVSNDSKDNDHENSRGHSIERQSLTAAKFSDIVKEVSEIDMKIKPDKGSNHKNFAYEVLKITVEGPEQPFFSIVDIPGLIPSGHDIRQDEKEEVEKMVIQYMKRPENIIICVATASADLSSQRILELAKDYIMNVVDAVCGRQGSISEYFEHGWFVVKNMTKEEEERDAAFDLDSAEQRLFGREPWSQVPKDRRGSAMLKRFLGSLLSEKIQDALPVVLKEIKRQLKEAKAHHDSLDPATSEHYRRRMYLGGLAHKYSVEVKDALDSPWHHEDPKKWTRKLIRDANDAFSEKMRESGHTYSFQYHDVDVRGYLKRIDSLLRCPVDDESHIIETPDNDNEIKTEERKTAKFLAKIKEEVALCSSTQLPGIVHPDAVHRLYKVQTARWHEIAEKHIQKIAGIVIRTAEAILKSICARADGGSFLHDPLLRLIKGMHKSSLEKVMETLEAFCHEDQNRLPQIHEPGYEDLLRKQRGLRTVTAFIRAMNIRVKAGEKTSTQISNEILEQCHSSAIDNMVNDVHDVLKAYYTFSLQSFIHHVTCVLTENFARDIHGALFGFSPDYVDRMKDAVVDSLGAESAQGLQQRTELRSKTKILEAAKKTVRTAQDATRQATK